jgi:hypothetical protein
LLHGTNLPLVGNDMPSEEVSAVSAPHWGLADAMEFPSRSVAVRHRMATSEEPQFGHGLRLFLLGGTRASYGGFQSAVVN